MTVSANENSARTAQGGTVVWLWKLRHAVDRRHIRRAVITVLGMITISLLEIAGIGAIFPLMAAIVDPGKLSQIPVVSSIFNWYGPATDGGFVLLMALGMLGVILVKVVATGFSYRWQFRFAYDVQRALSTRLLKTYLFSPYRYFLNRNTADMLKNIQSEIPAMANGVLIPSLQILGESIVFLGVFVFLAIVNPTVTLVMVLFLAMIIPTAMRLTRRNAERHALQRRRSVAEMYRAAAAGLSGFKDLKVLGRQGAFVDQYERQCRDYCQSNAHIMLMGQLPRLVIEVVMFVGLVGVLLYAVYISGDAKSALPLLGLYAVAAARLLPSLNKIVGGTMQIRYYRGLLDMLPQIFENAGRVTSGPAPIQTARLPFEREISALDLHYRYPEAQKWALKDVSLKIPKGKTIALIGPSGAGKTTLADVILGLLDDYDGQVLIDDTPLSQANVRAWQNRVGYVPQSVYLSDVTLIENVAFGVARDKIDESAAARAIEIAQLADTVAALPQKWDTVIGERGVKLSGGQRQRIGIARALYGSPDVLVLDEATSALDGLTEREIAQEIELLAGKRTIIVIAHRISTIQKCDMIFILEDGRLTGAGTYDELLRSNRYFAKVVNAERHVIASSGA